MAEQIDEVEQTTVRAAAPNQSTQRVTTATASRTPGLTAERIIYYITGLLITLLAFRFILSLLGANRENAFAGFIYSLSYPFVAPFFGLFGYNVTYGVSHLETETLVAMVVYALVGYGISKLVRIARRAD